MHRPRILPTLCFSLVLFLPASYAQLGKNVLIPAGSEADRELAEISAAPDPAQKLKLIQQFAEAHPDGDLRIVADEQYVNFYIAAKQYDKAFDYGEKLFQLDPDNYANAVSMVRAANEKGDTEKLFAYGEKAVAIVQRFRNAPAPDGMSPENWTLTKTDKLATLKDDEAYIRESLLRAAYNANDPAKKADYLLRFAQLYPNTAEGDQAQTMAALTYQQAGNRAKMLEVSNSVLSKNPDNLGILLLLADDYSERNEQLDKAEAYAKKAMELTDNAKKTDQVSEEQWNRQKSFQKGMALSTLGEIDLQKKMNTQAVDYLLKAAPLLKSNDVSYARNQYRLGFAYLNLKKNPDAKKAFSEVVAVESPYKPLAQQKLNELGAAKPATKKPS